MTQKPKGADSTGGSLWVSYPIGPANVSWFESPTSDYPFVVALRRSLTGDPLPKPTQPGIQMLLKIFTGFALSPTPDSHNIRRSSPIRGRTDLITVGACFMTLTAFVLRAVDVDTDRNRHDVNYMVCPPRTSMLSQKRLLFGFSSASSMAGNPHESVWELRQIPGVNQMQPALCPVRNPRSPLPRWPQRSVHMKI